MGVGVKNMYAWSPYVLTFKNALSSIFIPIFVHKPHRSGYFIYENSYELSKARLELSFTYPFVYCVNGKQNDKYGLHVK